MNNISNITVFQILLKKNLQAVNTFKVNQNTFAGNVQSLHYAAAGMCSEWYVAFTSTPSICGYLNN
jgi:hypothetical protein